MRGDDYVEGVSLVVHKAMDLTNCDAFVLLTEMEDRVFVTARSRAAALDVAAALKAARRRRPRRRRLGRDPRACR